jgi:trk system potassium uptake protein TrkH
MAEKQYSRLYSICYFIGYIIVGLGLLQWIPLVTSVIYREWDIAANFMITSSNALLIGGCLMIFLDKYRSGRLSWGEGMVVAAGAWFVGMLLSALPYYLSGNYLSYLDCCFDVMSGFTTTGLVLIQDLEHVSNGVNMWRHLLTFVGGQGMVVLVLTFLAKGTSGAYKMYVGEAKDEKLAPNAVSTARYIWLISLVYLVVGTIVQWIAGMIAGLSAERAFIHGLWVFMAGWSTGGFAPMSQNILYYHSTIYEIATVIFFIIGSFNFALHYAALTGRKRELVRNIETISFTVTLTALILISTLGLMQLKVYPDAVSMFRKGFYQLISGHTTTGFMTIYAKQFYLEWGDIALFAIIIAMLIGGSACSTAGGFKGLRMGIIFNAFRRDVKRMVLPESMVSVQKIHHIRDSILEDNVIRSAFLIVGAYIVTFTLGTLVGMLCGYPFGLAAFESASVTGNVGLSAGLTTASMPAVLKITYIVIMWVARLEFMSVLSLGAYFAMKVKRKCQIKY